MPAKRVRPHLFSGVSPHAPRWLAKFTLHLLQIELFPNGLQVFPLVFLKWLAFTQELLSWWGYSPLLAFLFVKPLSGFPGKWCSLLSSAICSSETSRPPAHQGHTQRALQTGFLSCPMCQFCGSPFRCHRHLLCLTETFRQVHMWVCPVKSLSFTDYGTEWLRAVVWSCHRDIGHVFRAPAKRLL